jgi:hypothetical protein
MTALCAFRDGETVLALRLSGHRPTGGELHSTCKRNMPQAIRPLMSYVKGENVKRGNRLALRCGGGGNQKID